MLTSATKQRYQFTNIKIIVPVYCTCFSRDSNTEDSA